MGGVVVGLLRGGGVVVPHKSKKKVEQKIRQFRRALNRLDPLYVGKSKKSLFSGRVGLLQGECSSPTTTGGDVVVPLLQGGAVVPHIAPF